MSFVQGPAGVVNVSVSGSGPAVVLLHGLGGDIGFWEAEIAAWSDDFLVIAVDLRGSGSTPASPGGHTMDDLANDLAAVLDHLGLQRASVLGFSMGGNVAQAFALRHPERLDRLILASTFATMNPQARLFLDAVAEVYAHDRSARQMFQLICPWLFSIGFLAAPGNAVYTEYPVDAVDDQTVEDWQILYAAQRAFDATLRLGEITAQTLVLLGDEDRLVSLDDARALARDIPNAELRVLSGSGHLVNVEQPQRFQAVVKAALTAPARS